jgi:hypothetical protein
MRRWLVAAVVVVVVAGGLVGWRVLVAGHGSTPDLTACAVPTGLTGHPDAPAASAPGGGGLSVAETGFTQTLDGHGKAVSIGATVDNTSSLIAYRTRIRFRVLDAGAASAVAAYSGEALYQVIPVIMPGQRIGAAAFTDLLTNPITGVARVVASVRVELGTTQWWSPTAAGPALAAVSAKHISTQRSTVEADSGVVKFSATSPYCRSVSDRGVATVFRNQTGAIVGGNLFWTISTECPAGSYTQSVTAMAPIPSTVDDALTRDYPYCDPVAPSPALPQPGDPVNAG